MIVAITPNPALDITYRIARLSVGGSHRVAEAIERPGGKGLNVARVLAALGEPVAVSGFLGGTCGQRMRALIAELPELAHAPAGWVMVPAETRRTVAIVDDEGDTIFNEAGVAADPAAWDALLGGIAGLLDGGTVLACSGSIAPGTRPGVLAQLIDVAHELGARAVVDTSGDWLIEAARAGADLLKPNHAELLAATGAQDADTGVHTLLDLGAQAVAVSAGADGMSVHLGTGSGWRARGPRLSGNAIGAGDASVAAWCRGLATGADLDDLAARTLADAVALSAAAVLAPVAGEFDADAYRRLSAQITVEQIS